MALARVLTRAQLGVESPEVVVEVYLARGLPRFTIVGLARAAVQEARERVRAAVLHSGFEFPARAITVNLAPADLPKDGGRFDLAVAVGILVASKQLPAASLATLECYGELSLSGALRPFRGAVCVALHAARVGRALVVPSSNADEAALDPAARVYGAATLEEVAAHLTGRLPLARHRAGELPRGESESAPDLADVRGQPAGRRALEVAAAGGHSLLLIGPPGSGKTMLASRLPALLPPLETAQVLEAAALHSLVSPGGRWGRGRAFRSPHHTASAAALIGGGVPPRPGEVSLAHHGVLFLDEFPEFRRDVLESLREPLEAAQVVISRAGCTATFPARFQLVAAMNPCPCGYLGEARCECSQTVLLRYRQRLSGPLLDRIDIQVFVPRPPASALISEAPKGNDAPEASAQVAARVRRARERQAARGCLNQALTPSQLRGAVVLDPQGRQLYHRASERFGLSARSCHRMLAVARTLADLAGEEDVRAEHLAEAIGWRQPLAAGSAGW